MHKTYLIVVWVAFVIKSHIRHKIKKSMQHSQYDALKNVNIDTLILK